MRAVLITKVIARCPPARRATGRGRRFAGAAPDLQRRRQQPHRAPDVAPCGGRRHAGDTEANLWSRTPWANVGDESLHRSRCPARHATGRGRRFAGAAPASTMADVNRRGKIVAMSTVVVGVVVLVAAGIVGKDRIREEWWIYKLQSGEPDDQVRAAKRLGDLASFRAMPVLFYVLAETSSKIGVSVECSESRQAHLCRFSSNAQEEKEDTELWEESLRSIFKVARVAPAESKPSLLQAIRDPSPVIRAFVCDLLQSAANRGYAEELVFVLIENTDPEVRKLARYTLKRIQLR